MARVITTPANEPPILREANAANRKNMELLIQLRWLAVIGQVVTIALTNNLIGISLPVYNMTAILAALVSLNILSLAWLVRGGTVGRASLLVALILDIMALTGQLWLSGGDANPFVSLYLLQITLAAVLLDAASTWALVALCCVNYLILTRSNHPLMLHNTSADAMFSLHGLGMLVCFVLDAGLLVVFVTRIARNLQQRDERLASLRQQAVEEDHIVRIGLLASGAAHELGTPLASVAVILNDWSRLPAIAGHAEMEQELDEMQTAIARCKSILSGILLSAGEARGEAVVVTSVQAMLKDIEVTWAETHPNSGLDVRNLVHEHLPIIADTALRQVLLSLLDNANAVSPSAITLTASHEDNDLLLSVSDLGRGFPPEILSHLGQPYQSTKTTPGSGLGLFLVTNVARKLGGSLSVENKPSGGARVTLRLPLGPLTPGVIHNGQ